MCGICGIIYKDRTRFVSEEHIMAMRDALSHRGPDDAGTFAAPGVALGSSRLAILDLSARGHMPMSIGEGRYWITYNGEVYNYRELRAGLEGRGHTFRSNTDTEVVLRLYEESGPAMLQRLNGMFAFAIWDNEERTLFMARDRMGVKPLYYAHSDEKLLFASEEEALFAAGFPREFDHDSWEELLCFRYVAGERTPFCGVKRLLPGHYLTWRDGRIEIRRWWNLAERVRSLRESAASDSYRTFEETFDDAVALRRISDVPIGVLLSGGLDSASVAASLASSGSGSQISSFTVRFAEKEYDEGPLAREVADRFHLRHHELEVAEKDFMSLLRDATRLNGGPLVHGSDLHLLAISRYAKPHATVLLSGEGGDEALGGYVRYQPLKYPALLSLARPILPRITSAFNFGGRLGKLSRFLELGSLDQFVLFNSCEVLPEDVELVGMNSAARYPFREQVLGEAKDLYPGDLMRQAMYSDQHTFLCSILDRNDRMTMGASIECRVPFLDYRLVEMLATLPSRILLRGRETKHLLRQSIGKRLPESILRHRKWGFGVPWHIYLRRVPELRDLVGEIPHLPLFSEGPFDNAKLQSATSGFLRGDTHYEELVKQLFMIAIWHHVSFTRAHRSGRVLLTSRDEHILAERP